MTMTSNNPWKVTKVSENDKPETYQVDLGKLGSCNAIVAQGLSFETATLLRSAPELLEALIAALPYVEMAEHDESYKKGSVAKMVKRMRDAISKAEGL